jgi:hypothetical protein
MAKIKGYNKFATACIEAVGLNPSEVRRIIIDMDANSAMMISVEMYGTDRFYNIVVPSSLEAKIQILHKSEKE